MGMFSGLFGGGGSAKRAANVAAAGADAANKQLGLDQEKYNKYYTPYREAGEGAIGRQQGVMDDVGRRISAIDPQIDALKQQQLGLQPQVDEMYGISQQQDPIVRDILGGGQGFQESPGYQFAMEQNQKAIERSRAAEGTLNQGATGKELTRYAQGMANQEFQNYLNNQHNALNAVGTQLGGRQSALGAGQNQINAGINLLGQDFNQIAAQMGVSGQYQQLINSGVSAADAAAQLGMNTANAQAGLTKGKYETIASGMIEKDRQMKASGDAWLNLGSAAVMGEAAPTFNMAGGVNNPYGQSSNPQMPQMQQRQGVGGQQPQQSPLGNFFSGFNNSTAYSAQPGAGGFYGPQQPGYEAGAWQNPDNQASAQRLGSQSSYRVPGQQAPGLTSQYGF